MARVIIIRNFYSYYITKSPTLDNMDGSDAILCWQSTSHHVLYFVLYFVLLNLVKLDDKKLKKKYFQNSHKSNMAAQIIAQWSISPAKI